MQGQLRLTGGRKLLSPRGSETRPTTSRVREAVMNILSPRLPGCRWLDLCSGSGVMGCEALQRGAGMVLAVESNPKTARICEQNLGLTQQDCPGESSVKVVRSDVISWLSRGWTEPGFDLVYLDPPYMKELYQPSLDKLISGKWLNLGSLVICEHSGNNQPVPGDGWVLVDQRRYGTTGLLMISPREHCLPDGTDSRQRQTDPSE
jgi:16S rRNA (guanine966-N2)-methyltransferase